MSEEAIIKADKDYSATLDTELPEIEKLTVSDHDAALERLLSLEKKVRQASDLASSQRVLTEIVRVLRRAGEWKRMNEMVQLLSKKHGQLKTAIVTLVQEVIAGLDESPDLETKIDTIEQMRTISEGKIFLELERARITRTLAHIYEKQGDVAKAADLLGELQIETLGNMDMKEKTDFILEQIDLYVRKGDFSFAQIVSRKILPRYFNDTAAEVQDQKLKFYELTVEIALHDARYLDVCQDYRHIYDTPKVEEDEAKRHEILQNMVLFAILSPFDNLQSDLLHKLSLENDLQVLPLYEQLVRMFTMDELIRWPKVEEVYGATLKGTWVFNPSDASKTRGSGADRWADLRSRVIEHNIRVVAQFYTRISIDGLSELLDLSPAETEQFLAKLVVNGTVYARIDRPKRVVSFQEPKDTSEVLNAWSSDTARLLQHVERIGHLISKEEMMHGIRQRSA